MLTQELKEQILNEISPSIDEEKYYKKHISKFVSTLTSIITLHNYPITIFLGGSYAKNTYIKNDFDVDIFFQFSHTSSYLNEKKSTLVRDILQEANCVFQKEQGSREYFSGEIFDECNTKVCDFEAVPTQEYLNTSDALNSTDISLFHVNYFTSKLHNFPFLCDEVRLLKMWCKANEVYGAESYIQGLSGHCIECLIMYFKTFDNVISFFLDHGF